MSYIAVGHSRTVQVDVAHLVVVAAVESSADVPAVQRIKTDVERGADVGAPVAVDVLRTADASASGLVVGDDVADGVRGATETAIRTETPVAHVLGNHEAQAVLDKHWCTLHLEVCLQVCSERRLQSRVTHRDIQRIGIVVDIEQLRDVGLLRLTSELHLQIGLLVEAVT